MLLERQTRVLHLVAETYIDTAKPVPSSHVARHLACSSATVRNEFAALEEQGLLMQPHTSAGRIPTPLGFGRYARDLLPPRPLPYAAREHLQTKRNRQQHPGRNTQRRQVALLVSDQIAQTL